MPNTGGEGLGLVGVDALNGGGHTRPAAAGAGTVGRSVVVVGTIFNYTRGRAGRGHEQKQGRDA